MPIEIRRFAKDRIEPLDAGRFQPADLNQDLNLTLNATLVLVDNNNMTRYQKLLSAAIMKHIHNGSRFLELDFVQLLAHIKRSFLTII
ncbi:hypothetical protein SFRURICE_004824 [Spodoptera frugiperda]|nr:hypothetical protein SFRURICE_004824 [Spodoptera frugiperda]